AWPLAATAPARPARAPPPTAVRITSPAPDSTFRRLSGLQPDTQQLALNAVSDGPGETLHWFVNDRYLGAVASGETLFWPLERGTHQIVCSTGHGADDRVRIAVE
ncbi:MAG: hypothetical protein K9N49_09950, partial [Candidatus Marinimicrobia bacterium]|nr:hypothetical protein [Candidatus Neomarinimicrobiota bacterium]